MKIEDFTLKIGDDSIPWRLFTPHGSVDEYIVLWIQGWTSSMESHREGVIRMSNTTNLPFATLDFAGHGTHQLSLEESTRQMQLDECAAVFDELKRRGFDKIIVIGGSFGGYMAALLTGIRPVHTVVLRVPAMYDDAELAMPHKQTRKWQNPSRDQQEKAKDPYIADNAAVRALHSFTGYTYIVEHELDEQVPRIMPRTYYQNAQHGNYLLVPDTKHSPKLMPDPVPYFAYIEHWVIAIIEAVKLQEHIPKTSR